VRGLVLAGVVLSALMPSPSVLVVIASVIVGGA
jgi:hypothetical protein